MSVKPRGTSFQATAQWKGRRVRKDHATEAAAWAWHAEALAALKEGREPEGEAPRAGKITTLGQLAEHVIETHWKIKGQSAAEGSIRNAREVVAAIGAGTRLEAVNYAAVETFKTALLKKGKAHGTVNRKLAALSRILTEGQKLELKDSKGHIMRRPVIDFLRETEGRIRTVTPAEELRLIAMATRKGDTDMADYIVLSIDTGMRQGELLKVTSMHVSGNVVVLDGRICKSKKGRSIPMTDRVRAIWARRAQATELGGRMFPKLTKAAIRHRWATLLELCEITDDTLLPHCMRHTFCSRLADRGAAAPAIQMLAGHSTLTMSQRYIHMSARGLSETIALLNPAAPHATTPAPQDDVAGAAQPANTLNPVEMQRFFH